MFLPFNVDFRWEIKILDDFLSHKPLPCPCNLDCIAYFTSLSIIFMLDLEKKSKRGSGKEAGRSKRHSGGIYHNHEWEN